MKSSLGSEVLLRMETLSEDNYAIINLLRAPEITWSSKLRLYGEPKSGGLQGTDRAITTCRLPLNHGEPGKQR
jgi:hypothetical protein